ncbi:MAG: nicotinate-nucleotide adenylyltransferase [Betaproteobacteria bacterium]|nr:nicotinate-nucleotide adenylyltransferase [Betaproteobacteria bacterium]MDE2622072.1 nicotinate-nucleotide adenylyltransferase [Betaproteobacteria bacterium]
MNGTAPVGILGGTFDPMHAGHLALAQEALRQLHLSCVLLIPAGGPWQRTPQAPPLDRLEMVRRAVGQMPGLQVDDREVRRKGPTYTIDTLRELRAEWGNDRPLWLILGADAFLRLPTWHRWQELLDLVHLAVFCRPGSSLSADSMPLALRREFERRCCDPGQAQGSGGAIAICRMPLLEISATQIRNALRAGQFPADLLPPAVLDYIETHQLYR